ncbi:MAG TPA: 50S ribosomal protein L11 methyltransferase [Longimicrobiales bacterium]
MPRQWLVVTVPFHSQDAAENLSNTLFELGAGGVEQTSNYLTTYLHPPADFETWLMHAREALQTEFEWRWQDDQDWSETWKQGLQPRRVGRQFRVAPSWTQPQQRNDDRVIVIDPEMAFGTGEHATTRGALRFLEMCVRPGDRVLDVGTGSAILAIGAAMCGASDVLGVEYDPDAIINAQDNITRNGVAEVVRLETALVDDLYLQRCGNAAFDIIAANVLSSVLVPLLPSFHNALRSGGYLILGGILEAEADDLIGAAQSAGFILRSEDLEDEWWGGLLQRPE